MQMSLSIYQLLIPWYWLPYQINEDDTDVRGPSEKSLNELKCEKRADLNLCGQSERE